MKRTVFLNVLLTYLFVAAVTAPVIPILYVKSIEYQIENHTKFLKDFALFTAEQIKKSLSSNNYTELDRTAALFSQKKDLRITVFNTDGIVLTDSEFPIKNRNYSDVQEIRLAAGKTASSVIRYNALKQEEELYFTFPAIENDSLMFILRISRPLSSVLKKTNELFNNILIFAGFFYSAALIFSLIFAHFTSLPVKRLLEHTENLLNGNYKSRIIYNFPSEMRKLTANINLIAGKFESLTDESRLNQDQFLAVVNSLQGAFFMINHRNEIIFSNRSFNELMNHPNPINRKYWEVIREPECVELIKKSRRSEKSLINEIEMNNRIYIFSLNYLQKRHNAAGILYDITELAELDRKKRDLVSNVSHELKTPLTSIKGFIETLEEEITDEVQKSYLKIMRRNTDRINNIVNDLLTLSELEHTKSEINAEETDLRQLIRKLITIFEKRICDKGLSLKIDIPDGIPVIKIDPFKIEQVFINLIDNAIKYTESGEIGIKLRKRRSYVEIKISDTGVGIPESDLHRIFERFYVVDKSRSKQMGGTGLGLSIVKHIVQLHKGSIEVSSSPGKSTIFTVRLPI